MKNKKGEIVSFGKDIKLIDFLDRMNVLTTPEGKYLHCQFWFRETETALDIVPFDKLPKSVKYAALGIMADELSKVQKFINDAPNIRIGFTRFEHLSVKDRIYIIPTSELKYIQELHDKMYDSALSGDHQAEKEYSNEILRKYKKYII